MRRFWILPSAVLALVLAAPAYAQHGGHGHSSVFFSFGFGGFAPFAPLPTPYAYYPYPYASYPDGAAYASPVGQAPSPAPIYAPPSAEMATYYFCPATNSYYPYVASCAVAWQRRPATPADPQPRSAAVPPARSTAPAPPPGSEPRVVSRFKNAAGQECQEFEETILIDGAHQRATGTACQGADGRRVISPSPAIIRESKN